MTLVSSGQLAADLQMRAEPRRFLPKLPPLMVVYVAIAYVAIFLTSIHIVRDLQLALPLVAIVIGAAHCRTHQRGSSRLIPLALPAFLLWCIASYAWSTDPHDSAHQVLEFVAVALTGLIAAVVLDRRDLMRSFSLGSKLLIAITGISLVIAYHSAAAPPALDPAPGWHGPVGGKNILGFLMALALINFICEKPYRRSTGWWMAAAAVLLVGSQSGAGLCITLMTIALITWEAGLRGVVTTSRRMLFKLTSVVLVAGGVLFLLTDFPAATSLFGKNSTLTGRTAIWTAVVQAIGHKAVFGYGFAGVWYNKVGYTALIWKSIGFPAYEAHDIYLDVWLQTGLVGLVLLLVVIVAALARMIPSYPGRNPVDRWLLLSMIALLVEGVVESDLTGTGVMLFAAITTASLVARPRRQLPPADATTAELDPTERRSAPSEPTAPRLQSPKLPVVSSGPLRLPPLPRSTRPLKVPVVEPASGTAPPRGKSETVKDAGWASAQQIVSVASAAILFLILTRNLGPTDFGYYAALAAVTGLISTVVYGWSGLVVTENVIRDKQPASEAMSSMSSWLAIGAVVALAFTALVAKVLVPQIPLTTTLVYVAGSVIGLSALGLGSATIQSVRGYAASTRLPLLQQCFFLALLLAIWFHNSISLLSVGLATLFSAVVFGVINLRLAARSCGFPFHFGRPRFADLKRGSLYAVVLLAFASEEDIDKPLLVRYGFTHTAGLYAAAYNIVTLGMVPLDAATAATHNRFLRHDPEATGQHSHRSIQMTVISGMYGLIAGVALWLGAPIVPHVLGSMYRGTPEMIRALAFLVVLRSLTVFPFNGLMGLGRRGWRTFILVLSAAGQPDPQHCPHPLPLVERCGHRDAGRRNLLPRPHLGFAALVPENPRQDRLGHSAGSHGQSL